MDTRSILEQIQLDLLMIWIMEKEKKENSRITLGIPALVTEGSKLMDKNGMVEITILMEWSIRISLMYEQRPKGNKGGSLEDFWEKSSWKCWYA